MTRDEFWKLVDDVLAERRRMDLDQALDEQLKILPESEIEDFAQIYAELQCEANTKEVFEAALILGIPEDEFMDFRRWLVFQGRETFTQVLQDPDYLGDYQPWAEAQERWRTDYSPEWVYEEISGDELPEEDIPECPEEPAEQDRMVLADRYSRLWRRVHG